VGGFPDLPLFEDRVFSGRMRRTGRALAVRGRIITSARRFRERGRWSMLCKSQVLKLLFMLGVSPHRLSAMYQAAREARMAGDARIPGDARTAGGAQMAGGARACRQQPL